MAERPILFSGPMVHALLDGRKTQTRRAVKLPTKGEYHRPDMGGWEPSTIGGAGCHARDGSPFAERACIWNQTTGTTVLCPYGVPGDRLWVRESITRFDKGTCDQHVQYRADNAWNSTCRPEPGVRYGVPSIHMPRWASRLTLEIAEVRVERLQDISEADAIAEGSQEPSLVPIIGACWSEREAYAKLWEHINGVGSWAANPWVWAVSFTRAAA